MKGSKIVSLVLKFKREEEIKRGVLDCTSSLWTMPVIPHFPS